MHAILITLSGLSFGWLTYYVGHHGLAPVENEVLKGVQALPGWMTPFWYTFAVFGTFYFAGLVVLSAGWLRKIHQFRSLTVASLAAWGLAWLLGEVIIRMQPAHTVETIFVEFSFPSPHVALVFALAVSFTPYVRQGVKLLLLAAAGLTGVAYISLVSILLYDAVAGALLGVAAGYAAHLLFGVKKFGYSKEQIKLALSDNNMPVKNIRLMNVDARSAIVFRATGQDGDKLIKVYGPAGQSSDWLFKLYRKLVLRNTDDEAPHFTSKQKVEHEMLVSLMVEKAGIKTPSFETLAKSHDNVVYSVQKYMPGKSLDKMAKKHIDEAILKDIWRIVKKLRAYSIAHRDLRPANLYYSDDNQLYLIDFDFSQVAASRFQLDNDVLQTLISLSLMKSPELAVKTGIRIMGKDTIRDSLRLLQPRILPASTRRTLKQDTGKLEEVISEIERQTDANLEHPVRVRSIWLHVALSVVLMGLFSYFLLPKLGELERGFRAVADISLWYIPVLAALSFGTYVAAALSLRGAIPHKKSLYHLTLLQFAGSFVNRITPSSLGSIGLNIVYLHKQDYNKTQASLFALLPQTAGLIVSLTLVLMALPFVDYDLIRVDIPFMWIGAGTAVLLAASGVAYAVPKFRKSLHRQMKRVIESFKTIKKPSHLLQLFGGALLITLTFGGALFTSAVAMGIDVGFIEALLVMLAGTTIGSVSPAPGGLAVEEAGLVAGLSIIGANLGAAVAAVLIYRLATFWMPIPFGMAAFRLLRSKELV